ncbi:DUF5666 domain-containing protein [Mycobacterium sp. 1164966.3]|uniref:DUF5666 domain-containing protein n=1 Tax=Mycobacterium sp. 1164966.3 TaxID=1856861 RepID=UPI00156156BC|nr:DUF5666 domain-containing protein [Mycobacterium sp. 1164966.3]
MSAMSARLSRVAILAVTGATALSLAACSSTSNPPSATSSAGTTAASPGTSGANTPSATPPSGEAQVSGLIASVSGSSAQVTQKSGNATVNFTGSTKVTEVSTAALTDVTPGSCVSIRSAHGSHGGKPITAATVRVSQAVDGKCPTGKESAPDSTTTAPSSPSPTPSPSTPSGKKPDVAGTVASVSGNTINVTGTDANGNPSQTAVMVDDKTRYTKRAPADTQAIAQGKCMTAKGTKDSAGALQATTINLRPANNGKCGRD